MRERRQPAASPPLRSLPWADGSKPTRLGSGRGLEGTRSFDIIIASAPPVRRSLCLPRFRKRSGREPAAAAPRGHALRRPEARLCGRSERESAICMPATRACVKPPLALREKSVTRRQKCHPEALGGLGSQAVVPAFGASFHAACVRGIWAVTSCLVRRLTSQKPSLIGL